MMLSLGETKGIPSGILLSCIVEEIEEARDFMIDGLVSEDRTIQRCCLVALKALVCGPVTENTEEYLKVLKEIAPRIHQENAYFLITSLQCAFELDANAFESLLNSEITRRGAEVASIYVNFVRHRPRASIALVKKSVEILESKNPNSIDIDPGLAKIYESDSDFVIDRIKTRLDRDKWLRLLNGQLLYQIKKTGIEPVLSIVEQKIDEGHSAMRYIGPHILEDLFSSLEEWVSWCENWREDSKKE